MLQESFRKAVQFMRSPPRPLSATNAQKLELYGLYKYVNEGGLVLPDGISYKHPQPTGYFDFEGKAKWAAWLEISKRPGINTDTAMLEYLRTTVQIINASASDTAERISMIALLQLPPNMFEDAAEDEDAEDEATTTTDDGISEQDGEVDRDGVSSVRELQQQPQTQPFGQNQYDGHNDQDDDDDDERPLHSSMTSKTSIQVLIERLQLLEARVQRLEEMSIVNHFFAFLAKFRRNPKEFWRGIAVSSAVGTVLLVYLLARAAKRRGRP